MPISVETLALARKSIKKSLSGYAKVSQLSVVKDGSSTDSVSSYKFIYTDDNGSQIILGEPINIPKDFLVKSATVKICIEPNVPVEGYEVGDKYIDFEINTKDGEGEESHLYIAVKDLIQLDAGAGIEIDATTISVNYGNGLKINDDDTSEDKGKLEVDFDKVGQFAYAKLMYVSGESAIITQDEEKLLTQDDYTIVFDTNIDEPGYISDVTYNKIKELSETNQIKVIGRIYTENDEFIGSADFIGDCFVISLYDEESTQIICLYYDTDNDYWKPEKYYPLGKSDTYVKKAGDTGIGDLEFEGSATFNSDDDERVSINSSAVVVAGTGGIATSIRSTGLNMNITGASAQLLPNSLKLTDGMHTPVSSKYQTSKIIYTPYRSNGYELTFPEQSGTFALTSDLDALVADDITEQEYADIFNNTAPFECADKEEF